jgi:DNA-binding transcriptional regulator YiaG
MPTLHVSEPKKAMQARLNAAFDAQRARLGFTNDVDFARYLGVSAKTLSFWRNGRWLGADSALITASFGRDEGKSAA